jgi:hypothetical protein
LPGNGQSAAYSETSGGIAGSEDDSSVVVVTGAVVVVGAVVVAGAVVVDVDAGGDVVAVAPAADAVCVALVEFVVVVELPVHPPNTRMTERLTAITSHFQ